LADAQFDLTSDVFHHLNDLTGVFEETHRALQLSGALCLATLR
jgi:hypothetical protein